MVESAGIAAAPAPGLSPDGPSGGPARDGARTAGGSLVFGLRFLLAFLRARPMFALGYFIVIAVVLMAIFAPWIAPYPPETANPEDYLQPPNWRHWLGTDATGMDVLSRLIYAPRVDLTIAIVGTLISFRADW